MQMNLAAATMDDVEFDQHVYHQYPMSFNRQDFLSSSPSRGRPYQPQPPPRPIVMLSNGVIPLTKRTGRTSEVYENPFDRHVALVSGSLPVSIKPDPFDEEQHLIASQYTNAPQKPKMFDFIEHFSDSMEHLPRPISASGAHPNGEIPISGFTQPFMGALPAISNAAAHGFEAAYTSASPFATPRRMVRFKLTPPKQVLPPTPAPHVPEPPKISNPPLSNSIEKLVDSGVDRVSTPKLTTSTDTQSRDSDSAAELASEIKKVAQKAPKARNYPKKTAEAACRTASKPAQKPKPKKRKAPEPSSSDCSHSDDCCSCSEEASDAVSKHKFALSEEKASDAEDMSSYDASNDSPPRMARKKSGKCHKKKRIVPRRPVLAVHDKKRKRYYRTEETKKCWMCQRASSEMPRKACSTCGKPTCPACIGTDGVCPPCTIERDYAALEKGARSAGGFGFTEIEPPPKRSQIWTMDEVTCLIRELGSSSRKALKKLKFEGWIRVLKAVPGRTVSGIWKTMYRHNSELDNIFRQAQDDEDSFFVPLPKRHKLE
jgi:hypothetical protein